MATRYWRAADAVERVGVRSWDEPSRRRTPDSRRLARWLARSFVLRARLNVATRRPGTRVTAEARAALRGFHPIVRQWFTDTLGAPSAPQQQGWPAIASGENALILAPTGTGKTLAAFLWELNALITDGLERPLANASDQLSEILATSHIATQRQSVDETPHDAFGFDPGTTGDRLSVCVDTKDSTSFSNGRSWFS